MQERKPARIYSAFDGKPELEEAIDAFVVGLAERIDFLQDAQASGDLEALARLSLELSDDARRLGYPQLAQASHELAQACAQRAPSAALRGVLEVTELGRRIRMGHPGAF
jgi:HPt (histidine-containing phosphotransfer) domain-containing protein